jgi:hypothetical protein
MGKEDLLGPPFHINSRGVLLEVVVYSNQKHVRLGIQIEIIGTATY